MIKRKKINKKIYRYFDKKFISGFEEDFLFEEGFI